MAFIKSFASAAMVLPHRLARAAFALSEAQQLECEAFRIRLGRPVTAEISGRERVLTPVEGPQLAQAEDLEALIDRVTGSSVHSYNGQMIRGFITTEQGHRLGLCGELVMEGGLPVTMRNVSSVNLRIAKQVVGVSDDLCGRLYRDGFESTLIVAPPGAGKTTLLRDMARWLSSRYSVSVVDERHELAACKQGVPRFDLGRCDVLTGSPKPGGMELLLRSMAPQVIAMDEITSQADVEALSHAAYCGCGFITTAHGGSVADLCHRPVYRDLMEAGIFRHIILIETVSGRRRYRIWSEGGKGNDQADRSGAHRGLVLGHGVFHEQEPQGQGAGAAQLYDGVAAY